MEDRRALVCNYAIATATCRRGARAYVRQIPGDPARVLVLARSRGGRLVERWEPTAHLHRFRFVTLPPEHPRYDDERVASWLTEEDRCRLAAGATSDEG
ncbi:MAG TPA: hypothetical protein VFL91_00665 [Thermomicrobiales bacterium]|nr:hypothetical protein [Thermomicrobiales bacterium]